MGLEYDRVLESLRLGGREFHILYSNSKDGVSDASLFFAGRVRDYLQSGPFSVKSFRGVNVLDLATCIRLLKSIVREERAEPGEAPRFLINVGTSSKIMTLASLYVAALEPEDFELYYPQAKDYTIMEIVEKAEKLAGSLEKGHRPTKADLDELVDIVARYRKNGATSKVRTGYEMISVPIVPIQRISGTQEIILKVLNESENPFESSSALADTLFKRGDALGATQADGARSTVSFALQSLVRLNLAQQRQVGKRKEISITEAGRLYCEVFLENRRPDALAHTTRRRR